MTPVTLDFETYWSTDFSLSKLSFIEYVKSPDFEAISVSVKVGNGPTMVYWGEDAIRQQLQAIDWTTHAAVAHNGNEFDFPVLTWKFDCHPVLFIDTLCMSRPKHQSEAGGSLKKLSEHYGLPEKNNAILLSTKGKRYIDFTLEEMRDMGVYNRGDTDNTYQLFALLAKETPKTEFALSDMTARMICYPQFRVDEKLLADTLVEVKQSKEDQLVALIDTLDVFDVEEVKTQLASAPKFAAVLKSFGVPVPMKTSKTTGKPTYALAKTDQDFLDLLEHPDPQVQMLAAARLGVKSTLLETRLAKMLTCSQLMGGWMPVPLAYHAATTGRWGGRVWNPQNLPRISRDKTGGIVHKLTNALRLALRAPDGYKVVVADLSGIELRVNHYLWGVKSTQDLYDDDPQADLYREFAAALFGISKDQVTKDQRQLAKVAQLGLGFGAGWSTFKKVAKMMGGVELDDAEALRVTKAWRMKYVDIVLGWKKCQKLVEALYTGAAYSPDPRCLVTSDAGRVRLPSGRYLYYPDMVQEMDDMGRAQYVYGKGKNRSKVYAGLMDENLVQAIARDVIAEQALRFKAISGHSPALSVHDELVYVIKADQAEVELERLQKVMRAPIDWMPGLVLWSEGDIADSYGEAK